MFDKKKTLNRSDVLDVILLDTVLRGFAANVEEGREVSIERVDFDKSPNKECDRLKGLARIGTVSIRFEVSINWSDSTHPDFEKDCVRVFNVSLAGEGAENKCGYKVTCLKANGSYQATIRPAALDGGASAKKLERRIREKLLQASPE